FAAEAVGVAVAVPALMMVANDGEDGFQGFHWPADFFSPSGVAAHYDPFVGVELAGLEQNGIGNADLSDVVEESSPVKRLELAAPQAEVVPKRNADKGQPLTVTAGLLVALLNGERQGKQDGFGFITG